MNFTFFGCLKLKNDWTDLDNFSLFCLSQFKSRKCGNPVLVNFYILLLL